MGRLGHESHDTYPTFRAGGISLALLFIGYMLRVACKLAAYCSCLIVTINLLFIIDTSQITHIRPENKTGHSLSNSQSVNWPLKYVYNHRGAEYIGHFLKHPRSIALIFLPRRKKDLRQLDKDVENTH